MCVTVCLSKCPFQNSFVTSFPLNLQVQLYFLGWNTVGPRRFLYIYYFSMTYALIKLISGPTFSDPDELLMVPYPAEPLSLNEGDLSRLSAVGVSTGVLRTHRLNQCSGSMTFWGGSGSGSSDPCFWLIDPDPGSGSCYFRHWPSRCQQKTNF